MRISSRFLASAVLLALGACAPGTEASDAPVPSPPAPSDPSPTPTIQDVTELELGDFPPLEPGTYSIDPDADPSTPVRVVYEALVEGWSSWIGAAKFAEEGWVAVSITSVTNLVRHGCRDHSPADPPVGPSVDDLATALADLAPFRVASPPKDVTIYGYSGKHLELTVPDMPFEFRQDGTLFTECAGFDWHRRYLMSWIAPTSRTPSTATRPGPHRGALDPRRRRHSPGDRGRPIPGLAPEGPRRAASHPRLHPDRPLTYSR